MEAFAGGLHLSRILVLPYSLTNKIVSYIFVTNVANQMVSYFLVSYQMVIFKIFCLTETSDIFENWASVFRETHVYLPALLR